ncbi:glycosyltransferase family 2 protein [Flagellimonas pacifica]|uniref:Glycosyltransferase involved in cell wall bisynthesis n=1 Tax=Flagellimonas pacifica TaxID=1247520 RepID=A0A285MWT9_9FLAO|nr:glycosyltransferase family 2 protein [Allomuricauda parva]SNZ00286.1 Glycosyltransferase involved in cell wall bisynthesis [Allomuricauda parva]
MAGLSAPKQKISALIITYNEMGYIEKCIDSITFADEIIVVDSLSTDGTFEYLQSHPNVKVIQKPFENFTAQKNFALKQAENDWVLFVDADEIVGHKLQNEIVQTVNDPNALEAYWFYRKFMFQNRPLHFSGWQTDKNHRLFRKSKVKYTNTKLVHETLEVDGSSGVFKEKLIHYCYKNYQEYKSKMLHYGYLKAKEKFDNGVSFNYLNLLIKPTWKFFYNFIVRLGFLDFQKGITICYLDALSVLERYRKLKQMHRSAVIKINLFMPASPEAR